MCLLNVLNQKCSISDFYTIMLNHTLKKTVKDILVQLFQWVILPLAAYSPDCALSDYYLFRSMQHGLADHADLALQNI